MAASLEQQLRTIFTNKFIDGAKLDFDKLKNEGYSITMILGAVLNHNKGNNSQEFFTQMGFKSLHLPHLLSVKVTLENLNAWGKVIDNEDQKYITDNMLDLKANQSPTKRSHGLTDEKDDDEPARKHMNTGADYCFTPQTLDENQSHYPIFAEYEQRALICHQEKTSEISDIKKAIQETYQMSGPLVKPFIFVCSSSGTGKTQLPFTLSIDTPLLYFVMGAVNQTSQKIYTIFLNQSKELKDAMIKDKESYDQSKDSKETYKICDISTSKIDSFTAGFLLAFWQQCTQLRKDHGYSWMQAQLKCHKFNYKAIPLQDARNTITTLMTKAIQDPKASDMPPAIVLDECVRISEDKFLFNRSLIRVLGFALVIMGTNTEAANFIAHRSSSTSRSHRNPDGSVDPWCYLAYQLPPVSINYLNTTYFDKLKEKIALMSDQNRRDKFVKLVNTFHRVIVAERPLFALQIAQKLSEFVDKADFNASTQFFEKLFYSVFDTFYQTKIESSKILKSSDRPSMLNAFSWGQVDYLKPRPPQDELSETYINNHIANVSLKGKVSDTLVRLYLGVDTDKEQRILYYKSEQENKETNQKFSAKSVMPSFSEQPLTGLSFSGPKLALGNIFKLSQRITCFRVSLNYKKECKDVNLGVNKTSKPLDGDFLEDVSLMSFLMASHVNGLFPSPDSTSYFRDIFPHFLKELHAEFTPEPILVDYGDDVLLWNKLDDKQLPYCATSKSRWNEHIYEYLTDTFQCRLGTIQKPKGEVVDVVIYEGNGFDKIVLTLEVKTHATNVTATVVKEKIAKGSEQRMLATINIMLALHFCQNFSSLNRPVNTGLVNDPTIKLKDLELVDLLEREKIWLVKLVKNTPSNDDVGGPSYRIESLGGHKSLDTTAKVYVLVEMAEILPAEELAKIKEFCRV